MEEPGILGTIICGIIGFFLFIGIFVRFGEFWYNIYQWIKDLFTKED